MCVPSPVLSGRPEIKASNNPDTKMKTQFLFILVSAGLGMTTPAFAGRHSSGSHAGHFSGGHSSARHSSGAMHSSRTSWRGSVPRGPSFNSRHSGNLNHTNHAGWNGGRHHHHHHHHGGLIASGFYYGPPYYYGSGYYGGYNRYAYGSNTGYNDYNAGDASLAATVQSALARLGYYRGPIDGVLGNRSRGAILSFQSRNGLPRTGRIDQRLLSALRVG